MPHRTKGVLIFVCMFLFAGVLYITLELAVPRMAAWTVPPKWKNIPLGQHRNTILDYLGQPPDRDTGPGKNKPDEWRNGTAAKQYSLRIYYDNDTVAIGYAVRYAYRSRLFSRAYKIDSALYH